MSRLDTSMESGLSVLDKRRLFSDSAILTFLFVGLAVCVIFWSGIWGPDGYLTESWSFGRVLLTLVTALYGMALGWMLFPRFSRYL